MSIAARYDRDADALYVTLHDGDRVRAIEIDEATYVDIDAEGQALGLEFLYPAMGLNLDAVLVRFGLHEQRHAIANAIAAAAAPGPVPTMTGPTVGHVSVSITTAFIEGTLSASRHTPVEGVTHADRYIRA